MLICARERDARVFYIIVPMRVSIVDLFCGLLESSSCGWMLLLCVNYESVTTWGGKKQQSWPHWKAGCEIISGSLSSLYATTYFLGAWLVPADCDDLPPAISLALRCTPVYYFIVFAPLCMLLGSRSEASAEGWCSLSQVMRKVSSFVRFNYYKLGSLD